MAEKSYHEDVVREVIRNSKGTLINRLPTPTLITYLECERIITEDERSMITVNGSTMMQQREKLVDTLLTKDGSAILKALDILKTRECGYRKLVDKLFADMDEMQKDKSMTRTSGPVLANGGRVHVEPAAVQTEVAKHYTFIRELQERCDQLEASLSSKRKESKRRQAKYCSTESKKLDNACHDIDHMNKPALAFNSHGSDVKRKADIKDGKKELAVQHHLMKQNNGALEVLCQWKIKKYQESLHTIESMKRESESLQRRIMELEKQLAEAELEKTKVLPNREGTSLSQSAEGQHADIAQAPVGATPKMLAVDGPKEPSRIAVAVSTVRQQLKKAFSGKDEDKQGKRRKLLGEEESSKSAQQYKLQFSDEDSEVPDTQDEDVLKCKNCGKIFPSNQVRHMWEHMSKCTRSEEVSKPAAKPAPASVMTKAPATPTKLKTAKSSSMISRIGVTKPATTDDLPRLEKREKNGLRSKYQSESCDVTHSSDHSWHRVQQSASTLGSNTRRPFNSPFAGREMLSSSAIAQGQSLSSPNVCGCGKTFADNQKVLFLKHKLTCPRGTPIGSPGIDHPCGATLAQKFR